MQRSPMLHIHSISLLNGKDKEEHRMEETKNTAYERHALIKIPG